jgi:hypothetical protein
MAGMVIGSPATHREEKGDLKGKSEGDKEILTGN